jgi:Domain of unknown function (DUF222)
MIEQSFDSCSPGVLLTAIEASQREESRLMARRMAAVADLLALRTAEAEHADPDPGYSMITGFARTSAEVAAAMNMAPMSASRLVSQAEALDARLPKLAALPGEGVLDWRTAQLIIARTELVCDGLVGQVDEAIAERLGRWQCWSRRRIINTVDHLVRTVDPDAAKERRASSERDRYLSVAAQADGTAQLRGRITATAAAAFDQRISQLAMSVCAKDSRTIDQRRADALTALTQHRGLRCDCGQPGCPARATDESPPGSAGRTVINVIASEATITGDSEQPGYLAGFGVIDADVVRELAENAALRLLQQPTVTAAEAMRYQPTAGVARWVRCRDLTCRFPGCDRPVAMCDLDHTTPFNHANPAAGGLTVPCGLADYCREHHRLKTFHGGPTGWRDQQLADGTIVFTAPTGRTYRTTPDGTELFPQMRPACAEPEPPACDQPERPACVEPTPRKRNRSREKAARIKLIRSKIRAQRPINAAQRHLDQARRREIDMRKWRNNCRKMLIIFKGGRPSTSPWCNPPQAGGAPRINEPFEPEELPPDWRPPPTTPSSDPDDPPF